MEGTAVIVPNCLVDYKGKVYLQGLEYTVTAQVARALGDSVEIKSVKASEEPTVKDVQEKMVQRAKNTMMTGKGKNVKKK